MLLLIAPVTTGEPVTTVVLTVLSAIAALFGGFARGVSNEVKSALDTLRGSIHRVSETLMRFGWRIARAFGWLLKAMHTAWVRVIRPMLSQLRRVMGRLRRLIERDLPRLLRIIDKIRARILEIYERWMRPVLLVIQRMRRMLLILRLLHIHWGDKLDAKLARLQEWVMYPLKVVMEHLAIVEQWINVIVSAEQLIQDTIFHNSVWHYQDPIVRTTLGAFGRPMDPLAKLELWPRAAAVPAGESKEHLRLYLRQGIGPIATDVQHALTELPKV